MKLNSMQQRILDILGEYGPISQRCLDDLSYVPSFSEIYYDDTGVSTAILELHGLVERVETFKLTQKGMLLYKTSKLGITVEELKEEQESML